MKWWRPRLVVVLHSEQEERTGADVELVIHFVLVVVRNWQRAPARVVLGQLLLDELGQLFVEQVLDDLPLVVLHAENLGDRLRELKQRRPSSCSRRTRFSSRR